MASYVTLWDLISMKPVKATHSDHGIETTYRIAAIYGAEPVRVNVAYDHRAIQDLIDEMLDDVFGGCDSCDDECDTCGDDKCKKQLADSQDQAMMADGMHCSRCGIWCRWVEPNTADGRFFCHKCRTDYGWQLRDVKWLSA